MAAAAIHWTGSGGGDGTVGMEPGLVRLLFAETLLLDLTACAAWVLTGRRALAASLRWLLYVGVVVAAGTSVTVAASGGCTTVSGSAYCGGFVAGSGWRIDVRVFVG